MQLKPNLVAWVQMKFTTTQMPLYGCGLNRLLLGFNGLILKMTIIIMTIVGNKQIMFRLDAGASKRKWIVKICFTGKRTYIAIIFSINRIALIVF